MVVVKVVLIQLFEGHQNLVLDVIFDLGVLEEVNLDDVSILLICFLVRSRRVYAQNDVLQLFKELELGFLF